MTFWERLGIIQSTVKCRCRTTASTSAFQAEDEGSTPFTCSKQFRAGTICFGAGFFLGTHGTTHFGFRGAPCFFAALRRRKHLQASDARPCGLCIFQRPQAGDPPYLNAKPYSNFQLSPTSEVEQSQPFKPIPPCRGRRLRFGRRFLCRSRALWRNSTRGPPRRAP